VEEARGHDVVIVAGGIGLAPLRPAIYHLLAHRGRYGRIVVLYGARTSRDLLYTRELARWRSRFDVDVAVTVDRGGQGWQGRVGLVTRLVESGGFDPRSVVALMCGPEVMMRVAAQAFDARGVGADNLYVSIERNMKCAIGLCGHCQLGPVFVCKDGPVFRYDRIRHILGIREV
jgi:NAD(P)H-flavin reductase